MVMNFYWNHQYTRLQGPLNHECIYSHVLPVAQTCIDSNPQNTYGIVSSLGFQVRRTGSYRVLSPEGIEFQLYKSALPGEKDLIGQKYTFVETLYNEDSVFLQGSRFTGHYYYIASPVGAKGIPFRVCFTLIQRDYDILGGMN